MASSGKSQPIRSSLPLAILLYINGWYFAFMWICQALMYIYKGEMLPYASGVLAAEIVLLFVIAGLEALRIFFGIKGNLTERVFSSVMCIVITIAAIFGILYWLLWQTYVLRAEVILCAIELTFMGLELIFAIIATITFARSTPY